MQGAQCSLGSKHRAPGLSKKESKNVFVRGPNAELTRCIHAYSTLGTPAQRGFGFGLALGPLDNCWTPACCWLEAPSDRGRWEECERHYLAVEAATTMLLRGRQCCIEKQEECLASVGASTRDSIRRVQQRHIYTTLWRMLQHGISRSARILKTCSAAATCALVVYSTSHVLLL